MADGLMTQFPQYFLGPTQTPPPSPILPGYSPDCFQSLHLGSEKSGSKCCVTSGKQPYLSEPPCLHPQNLGSSQGSRTEWRSRHPAGPGGTLNRYTEGGGTPKPAVQEGAWEASKV